MLYGLIRYKVKNDSSKWYFLWDSGIHPRQRKTVEERYENEVSEILTADQVAKEEEAEANAGCCSSSKVTPEDGIRQSEVVAQTADETVTGSRLVRVSPRKGSQFASVNDNELLVEEQVDFATTFVHVYFPPKPHLEPVKDYSISADPGYENLWVAQVALAHPTGSVSRKFTKNQKLLQKLNVEKAKLQKLKGEKCPAMPYTKGMELPGCERQEKKVREWVASMMTRGLAPPPTLGLRLTLHSSSLSLCRLTSCRPSSARERGRA